MAKGLIDLLLVRISDAEWQGRRGEKLCRKLRFVLVESEQGRTGISGKYYR